MRVLVTGADGFVGRWLVQHLQAAGDEVWQACGLNPGPAAHCVRLDVTDSSAISDVVKWALPETIYHLAAIAFGPEATANMQTATAVTIGGTVNILEAARHARVRPVVFIPSSAEVYGHTEDGAVDEATPVAPANPYGATKAAQEMLALAYHRQGLVPVVVARAFNHIGPGQSESFVVPAFAGQLADIVLGRAEPVLRVGNLDAERDFTDVRDVVRAYRLLTSHRLVGRPYNVASGRAVPIRTVLDLLRKHCGTEVRVEVDPTRLRAADRPRIQGSSVALLDATGWTPEIQLEQTLADVWQDALQRHGGN